MSILSKFTHIITFQLIFNENHNITLILNSCRLRLLHIVLYKPGNQKRQAHAMHYVTPNQQIDNVYFM